MLKLANSSINQDGILIQKTIKNNNVYAFTYLLRFLKNSEDTNLFELLLYILNQDHVSDKLSIIVINEMLRNGSIHDYIDHILEIVLESEKIGALKLLFENNVIYPKFIL